jgi:tetratricopeptide (TPR) repeat protein
MTAPVQPIDPARGGAPLGLLAALLALAVSALGWQAGFVWDDGPLLVHNPALHAPAGWERLLLEPFVGGGAGAAGHYRPLGSLLSRLAMALTPGSPLGLKLAAGLLHAACAALLWRLCARLFCALGAQRSPGRLAALFAASLFALAPVQAEAIWWASSASVPLHLACLLTALLASGAPFSRPERPAGSPACLGIWLLLALLSKDNAAVFPLLLAGKLALWGPAGAPRRRLAWAIAAATLLWLLLRGLVFGAADLGFGRAIVAPEFGWARRLSLALELFGGALGNALLPWWPELLRPIAPEFVPGPRSLLAAGGLLAFGLLVRAARRRRSRALAWVALGLTLLLLPIALRPEALGRYPLGDRQLYGAVALWAALGAGAGLAWLRQRPGQRTALLAAALGLLATSAWRSQQRAPTWRDDVALFTRATQQNPDSTFGWNALGRAHLERFRAGGDRSALPAAQAAYERTLELALSAARQRLGELGLAVASEGPETAPARELDWIASADLIEANLGLAWCLMHEAETDPYRDFGTPRALFERVLQAAPDSADARAGLAVAQFFQGESEAAMESLREALRAAPEDPALHRQAARMSHAMGAADAARRHAQRAIELDPNSPAGQLWLARAELGLEHLSQARSAAESARRLAPADPQVEVLLGLIAGRGGDLQAALRHFDAALALDPDHAEAHAQRGKALFALGQVEAGLFAWRSAVELDETLFEPQYNLASELLRLGQNDAARPHLRQAYANCPSPELRTRMRGTLANLAKSDAATLRALASVDRRRDPESALDWARLATEAEPGGAANWELSGTLLAAGGRARDAVEAFERARELGASGFLFVRARALALADAGLPEAAEALRGAIEALPRGDQEQAALLSAWREELERRLAETDQSGPPAPR